MTRRRAVVALVTAVAGISLAIAAVSQGSVGDTVLVSGPNETTSEGFPIGAQVPAISANGRYVAFATDAKNISRVDDNGVEDVFVRDLEKNRTILVSRATGSHGAPGNGDSSSPSISANGRYVAFESFASNLGPPDNGTVPDVFVRDLRTGRVFLASRAPNDGPAANAPSQNPSISANGQFAAFDSRGSNLSPADTVHTSSVFRYQLLP